MTDNPAARPFIGADAAIRIAHEVTLGIRSADSDTPEEAAYRATVGGQIDEIVARGNTVYIPSND